MFNPEMKVVEFSVVDVITVSGGCPDNTGMTDDREDG